MQGLIAFIRNNKFVKFICIYIALPLTELVLTPN